MDGVIEFNFTGTRVGVYGTNIPVQDMINPHPNYECFIDDVSIGKEPSFKFTESHWIFCKKEGLADGPHKLRIDVTVKNSDNPFYFDYIQYVPSAGVPLGGKVLYVDDTDPSISFDHQWSQYHGQADLASTSGAIAQVNFVGTSLMWVGIIPSDHPHNGTTATYNIDDEREFQVLLRGLSTSTTASAYHETFFATPELDPGPHTLTVTYLGSNETTPLVLDYLLINNGSATTTVTPGSSSPTDGRGATQSSSSSSSSSKSTPVGAIVGGVLGGLAVILLIGIAFLLWRRRILSRPSGRQETVPDPFHMNAPTTYNQGAVTLQPSRLKQSSWTASPTPLSSPINSHSKTRELSRPSVSSTPGSAFTDSHQSTLTSSTNIVTRQHLDSGLRLNPPVIRDIPPHYTPN